MFSNLNWYNVVILLLLALFIFGDKLPQIISDGLRLLRNLRRMAQTATTDLSKELGTDIRFEDLHPKTFVRKHLLSEADQEKLLQPLKSVSDDVVRQTRGVQEELKQVGKRVERTAGEVKESASLGRGSGTSGKRRTSTRPDGSRGAIKASDAAAAGVAAAGAAAGGASDPNREGANREAANGDAANVEPAPQPRQGFDDIT